MYMLFSRWGIALYFAVVCISILAAPDHSSYFEARLSVLIGWLPAARRLFEISQFPAKTLTWLLVSFAASPVLLPYLLERLSASRLGDKVGDVLKGSLIISLILTPWLLTDFYRPDMTRGGSLISAMGISRGFLAVLGPTLSTIYAVIYLSTLITYARFRKGASRRY